MSGTPHVYDLDGTLVRLVVDWEAARTEVMDTVQSAGFDIEEEETVWEFLDRLTDPTLTASIHDILAKYERDGAERAERLPAATALENHDGASAVCSLNSEEACRIALDRHGLLQYVTAVVGRDSVETRKPDPEPLLAAVRALDAEPEETLFIGDSERDALTAKRAGTQFSYVGDGPSGH